MRPGALTAAGWAAGAGACAATALRAWPTALGLWLANRLLDGLDGPAARAGGRASDAGGFADIVANFSVYAGIILGLAVAVPAARLACVALLTAYYVSGAACSRRAATTTTGSPPHRSDRTACRCRSWHSA